MADISKITTLNGTTYDIKANAVKTQGSATNSTSRHVWFSDKKKKKKRAHSDNFKYTPSTNTLSANITGTVNGYTVKNLSTLEYEVVS